MLPVQWCNLCQSRPAVGILSGFFENMQDEQFDLMACNECAAKAMRKEGE